MRRLSLLIVAACSGSPAPPPNESLSHQVEVVPRSTPAPSIAWKGEAFEVTGLPAVARAGEVAVVAMIEGDGGRGFPNLRIDVRDKTDKVVQTIPVLIANDYETLAPGGTPGATLSQRIADANHQLAILHGVHDLVAMTALELQKTADGSDPHLAIGDGFDVDWSGDHLHVFHHNTDKPLVSLPGTPWLVREHRSCAQCDVCSNPAFLAHAYHVPGINMLVIDIGYHGTDLCWEPGDQLHVVTW
jgi:hypothetical protein